MMLPITAQFHAIRPFPSSNHSCTAVITMILHVVSHCMIVRIPACMYVSVSLYVACKDI